jgi:hypothetical protein
MTSVKPVHHYIDGEFRSGKEGRSFNTLNPATNELGDHHIPRFGGGG